MNIVNKNKQTSPVNSSSVFLKNNDTANSIRQSGGATEPNFAAAAAVGDAAKVLSKEEIVKQLKIANVISDEDWPSVEADVAKSPDSSTIVRKLFERNLLTKFQAQNIYLGKAKWLAFGEYIVLDRIGAGGMGQVFKARHRRMDRLVALKVMANAAMKDPEAVKRFQREVKAAAKLVHPNIVAAFDAGEHGKVFYLVMEYVDGHDLAGFVKKNGPLPVAEAVDAILQAARGLAFAHAEGVVHRDIKPANLLRDKKGVVRVLDMGLARYDDPLGKSKDDGLTQSGMVMGTVDYMAPEQAFNTRDAGPAADVYSLGCTLYSLLTGQRLYDGESMIEKIIAHREKPIPPLPNTAGNVPAELSQLYNRMVAKQAADRPSMEEVIAGLERVKANPAAAPSVFAAVVVSPNGVAPFVVSETAKPNPAAALTKSLPWQWLAAIGGAAALLLLLGVWVIIRSREGKEIARVNAPAGSSVTVQPEPPSGTAENKAPASTPQVPSPATQPVTPAPSVPTPPPTPADPAPTVFPSMANVPASPQVPTTAVQYTAPHCLLFDGDDLVDIPTLKYDGSHDLTIEVISWVNTGNISSSGLLFGNYKISAPEDPGTAGIAIRTSLSKAAYSCSVGALPGRSTSALTYSRSITSGKWQHVACVLSDRAIRLFMDGKLDANSTASRTSMNHFVGGWRMGNASGNFNSATYGFRGGIQGARVSKTARYQNEFTPPSRLDADADTMAIYRFEEGAGELLKDSSGNNHHGKIIGATWKPSDSLNVNMITATTPSSMPPGPSFNYSGAPFVPTGPYYLEFDGNDRVEIPTLKYDGSYDLTMEAIVAMPQITQQSNGVIFGNYREGTASASRYEGIALKMQRPTTAPQFSFLYASAGSNSSASSPSSLSSYNPNATWYHFAVVIGDSYRSFINGQPKGSVSNRTRSSYAHSGAPWVMGNAQFRQNSPGFVGFIQGVRLSKTIRYQSSFSPPTQLDADANTIAVYRFEEGNGEFLKDSSGNYHHGKIIGAEWRRSDKAPGTDTLVSNSPNNQPGVPTPAPSPAPSPIPASPSEQPPARHCLKLNGENRIEIPTLKYDGTHDLTIEAIVSFKDGPKNKFNAIFSNYPASSKKEGCLLRMNNSSPPVFLFAAAINGSGSDTLSTNRGIDLDGTWHHVAVEIGESTSCYFNGKRISQSAGRDRTRYIPSTASFILGGTRDSANPYGFTGAMRGIRFSKIARYKDDYTPPEQFEVDADCMAVYRFEEGFGDVLKDSSGNNHHGKISGPVWKPIEAIEGVALAENKPTTTPAPAPTPTPATKSVTKGTTGSKVDIPAMGIIQMGSSGGGFGRNLVEGWEFEVKEPIKVTELGIFDVRKDGLSVEFPVAIWSMDGKEVARGIVPAGGAARLVDSYRYAPINPVDLPVGNYVIGALYTPKSKEQVISSNPGCSFASISAVRWVCSRRGPSEALKMPEVNAASRSEMPGCFGPNFLIAKNPSPNSKPNYYRTLEVDFPGNYATVVNEGTPDDFRMEPKRRTIALFARPNGTLTQVCYKGIPLGAGADGLKRLADEVQRDRDSKTNQTPLQVTAMAAVLPADIQAALEVVNAGKMAMNSAPASVMNFAEHHPYEPNQVFDKNGKFNAPDRFRDAGAVIEDRWTGLIWQKDVRATGKGNFYQAKDYAEKLELGGLKDWRVPKIEELRTIFPAAFAPFFDDRYNPDSCCNGPREFASYWTSELDLRADDYAYVFHWYAKGGANNCFASSNRAYVRCVHDPIGPGKPAPKSTGTKSP